MTGTKHSFWMLLRFTDGRDPVRIAHAFDEAWSRSGRTAFRWRVGKARAKNERLSDSELNTFREGRPDVIQLLGDHERGRLELMGHPLGDTLEWDFPYEAIVARAPGYTASALAETMMALGETGDMKEGFIALPEVRFSDMMRRFRKSIRHNPNRDWFPNVNWLDFVPVDRFPEVGGEDGLASVGLSVLCNGKCGVVV